MNLLKKARDRLLTLTTTHRTTLLDLFGILLLTVGVMLIFVPAGFIFAGIACLVVSARLPELGEVNGEST